MLAVHLKSYIKHIGGFVVLSIVIFLLPLTVNLYSRVILQALQNLTGWPFFSFETEQRPTEKFQIESLVSIDVNGSLEIFLIEGSSIEFPKDLKFSINEDQFKLTGGEKASKYIVRVGKEGLKSLQISAISISLNGDCSLEELQMRATAVDAKGNIHSKHLLVNGTGVNIDGVFVGEKLQLDGTGIKLGGKYSFNEMKIDGTGISLKIELNDCESVLIDGTGVNGNVDVTGNKPLKLVLNGTGGTVNVRNISKTTLHVQSSNAKVLSE
ncbi:MAG: hypothetical protein ABDH53_03805 [Pseudothermotoga sp.]